MQNTLDYAASNKNKRVNITWNAILTIAGRDVMRFLRDPMRLIFTLILPFIMVAGLSGPLQSNFGQAAGYNLMTFSITGLLAMLLFQSSMSGLVSLLEDRLSDFSQEMFIAPISRYAIVFGKILGEALVAMVQGVVLIILGLLVFNVPMSPLTLLLIFPVCLIICLFGGAFGVLLISLFNNQRTANMIMPFILFPQFFLSGVFLPVRNLPWYLDILSKIMPMRYVVDLTRGICYLGRPEYKQIVMLNPLINLAVTVVLFIIFLVSGTIIFVRSERNR